MSNRVAIFQYEWPLQSHTVNLTNALLKRGYHVDLLIKESSIDYIDMEKLILDPKFTLIDLTFPIKTVIDSRWMFYKKKIWKHYEIIKQRFFFNPVPKSTINSSINYLRKKHYLLFIGIEKKGLIWAGTVSQKTGHPFVYYSLELYDEKHPYFIKYPNFSKIRSAEKFQHQKALATIIQDYDRAIYLLNANELPVSTSTIWYLPVSVSGPKLQNRTNYFRDKYNISQEMPIVLYFGLIDEFRDCSVLSYLAKMYTGQFKIIAHGYGESAFLEKLREESNHELILSLDLVPENQIPELIASADLGIVLYRRDCANDLLTASSSEKVALFCKTGVPFVAIRSDSYVTLRNTFLCCELFDNYKEIYQSLITILNERERYREEAFKAFDNNYCLEKHINKLIDFIDSI